MSRPILFLTLALLSGCASLSKEECRAADWFLIGFGDGSAGRSFNTVTEHRQACAKVDVVPDLSSYERGHLKGAADYCTPENGFALGNSGGQYNGVCDKVQEDRFIQRYHLGKERFELRQSIAELSEHLEQQRECLDGIDAEIRRIEAKLINAGATPEERRQYLQSIRVLQDEESDLETTAGLLQYDLDNQQLQLKKLIYRQRSMGFP